MWLVYSQVNLVTNVNTLWFKPPQSDTQHLNLWLEMIHITTLLFHHFKPILFSLSPHFLSFFFLSFQATKMASLSPQVRPYPPSLLPPLKHLQITLFPLSFQLQALSSPSSNLHLQPWPKLPLAKTPPFHFKSLQNQCRGVDPRLRKDKSWIFATRLDKNWIFSFG